MPLITELNLAESGLTIFQDNMLPKVKKLHLDSNNLTEIANN
jgi:hypothetical protein